MTRLVTAALFVHTALTQLVTFALRPAGTYRALELDVSASWLGAIGATFALAPLLLALPLGALTDRLGERALMLAGALVMAGATGLFMMSGESALLLLAANAALGAGHLGCVLGQQTLVANSATSSALDARFGHYTFVASLGQALGPVLLVVAGGSSVRPDTDLVFRSSFGLCCLMVLASLAVRSARRASGGARSSGQVGVTDLLRTPGLPRALTASAVALAAVDLSVVYLPALGADRALSAAVVGSLLSVRAVASMASRLVLGLMSRALGRTRLTGAAIVLTAISMAACAVPMPVPLLFGVVVLMGFGMGVVQPLTMSWLTEKAPTGGRGRALSLRLATNRLGQVVVPVGVGIVAGGAGAAGVMVATAAVVGSTRLLLRGFSLDDR